MIKSRWVATGMKRFLADMVAKLARRPMRLFDTRSRR
jgi:hypothetical protein